VSAELGRLLDGFFQAVSFRPGQRPRYDRIPALFVPDGWLIRGGAGAPEISTVPQFVASRQHLFDAGRLTAFEEVESAAVTEVFGAVAHRFSTYAKRGVRDGEPFAGDGVISTQFIRTPAGWRMTSMAWDDERPGLEIPARYRPG